MTDVRLPASGNIMLRWHPANAFANPERPTPAEINAGLKLGDAVSWNDMSFGIEASSTINDPAITAKSTVSDRGAMQYGGSLSFYYPRDFADAGNVYKVVYDAMKVPRTEGFITMSVDGELSETNSPLYTGGATQTAVAGDFVGVFKVMTAGYGESITGEEAFRYTVTFLPQGEASVYTVIGTTSTVAITPATLSAVGKYALEATVDGRKYTRGLRWTTSNPAVATVSQNGIVTVLGSGSATITATFEPTGTSATTTVTVA